MKCNRANTEKCKLYAKGTCDGSVSSEDYREGSRLRGRNAFGHYSVDCGYINSGKFPRKASGRVETISILCGGCIK